MIKYNLKGIGIIEAENNARLVGKMNGISFFGHKKTLSLFMQSTAESCELQNGSIIRTDNEDNFVSDLILNGFIEIIND